MNPIKTPPTHFSIGFLNFLIVFLYCFLGTVQAQPFLKAKQATQNGYYEQAVEHWKTALAMTQEPSRRLEAWLGLANAYRYLGLYPQALNTLNTASPTVNKIDEVAYRVLLLNGFTQLHLTQKQFDNARQSAKEALTIACNIENLPLKTCHADNPYIAVPVLHQWGNLLDAEHDYKAALKAYDQVLTLITSLLSQPPEKGKNSIISLSKRELEEWYGKVLVNKAQATFWLDAKQEYRYTDKMKAFHASITVIKQALDTIQNWQDRFSEAFGLIAIGQLVAEIQTRFKKPSAQLTRMAYQALNQAREIAEHIDNAQAKTYAYGYLGQLYEQAQHYQEALTLTRQALFSAQQIHDQLLLYQWQWQLGRIFKVQGDNSKAIAALQQAVKNINTISIREQVMTMGYLKGTFRKRVSPVYFELADLLLQKAQAAKTTSGKNQLLREARKTIELFKTAELQDYFQSECVAVQTECTQLEQVLDAQTAILYPIVFSQRLELLLTLPNVDNLVQVTVPVSEKKLRREIAFFLSPLRRHPFSYAHSEESETEEFSCVLSSAQYIPLTKAAYRRTQAFLRPAKQLYHWLIQPITEILTKHNIHTLIVVPEGVLRTIPFAALHDGQQFLVQNYALATSPSLCLSNLTSWQRDVNNMLLGGLSEAVQGFSSLPCAKHEIKTLQKSYNLYDYQHVPLLDKTFTYPNMQNKIRQTKYSIVHIASHGQFKPNLQDTFLLTYNDTLSMNKLEQIVRRSTLQEKPVELLTLSACETAVGNDRAALGLAGVALKAGVKSALASLWKVDDAATPAVLIEFYRQLTNPTISKAQALQNAQKMMLTNKKYMQFQHPYYWSAFLLIGNWL